jgi:glucokinase
MTTTIAVDIGGTQIRVAVFANESIRPMQQKRIPTHTPNQKVIDRIAELITELWPKDDTVTSIGLAAPGPLDPAAGIVRAAPNIPEWINFPLQKELEDRLHVPVRIGNDANLAAVGEWRYGAGQGHHNVLYLTISTGIGGGVILADRLLLGEHGLACELGHIVIQADGPVCSCGQLGHLEAYSAGPAIAKFVAEQLANGAASSLAGSPTPTTAQISAAAVQGDALALSAFERAGRYLGLGITSYLHAFNPSIVILGGGVTNAGELLFAPMRKAMQASVMSPAYLEGLQVTTAALGDDVGLLGALALARGL